MPHPPAAPTPIAAVLVAGLLAAGAALAPAAGAASPTVAGAAACRGALADARGHRLLAMGGADDVGERPVWLRRTRTFVGVVGHAERGRYRLRVCTAATSETDQAYETSGEPTMRTVRGECRTITVPRGRTVVGVAVADPWISWTTVVRGRDGFRVHRRTIDGDRPTARSFRGRPTVLATTRDGTTVLSTREGDLQRIHRWATTGRTTPVVRQRHVLTGDDAPADRAPLPLELWDPDTFAVMPPGHAALGTPTYEPLAPRALVRTARTRPCRSWAPADDPLGARHRTTGLSATLTASESWSRRMLFVDEWTPASTVSRLEVCDGDGRRLLAVPAGYDTHDDDNDGLSTVGIAGDVVLATSFFGQGYTGSGSTSGSGEIGFVRPAAPGRAWRRIGGRNLATRDAAAWTDDGSIWVSDAAGTRRVAPIPEGFRGLRLARRTLSVVTATGTTSHPVAPLPADRTTFTTASGANFGVCSDQHSRACPDPGDAPGR